MGNGLTNSKRLAIVFNFKIGLKMKLTLIAFLISLFIINANGQIRFSNIDVKLGIVKSRNSTQLSYYNSTLSYKFELKHTVTRLQDENFVKIDSQIIQITPLQVDGYKKSPGILDTALQRQFLEKYAQYELDYMKNELNVEIINLNSQWVISKTRGWFIWYFRPKYSLPQLSKQTEIQLFASTIIGDKVLTLNAPIQTGENFGKAAYIVNEIMESLKVDRIK
jgi:hypothetical protein